MLSLKKMKKTIHSYKKYNLLKIMQVNHSFKKKCHHIKDVFIFWDLDNTIYLFSEWGKDKEAVEECMKDGFYTKLPIFPGAAAFLKFLMSLCPNVYILSKYPRSGADLEKIESIKRDMPFFPESHIILVGLDVNKGEVIQSICNPAKALIIDDYYENIIDAYNMNVIGIKKSFSGKKRPVYQIQEFYELLFILKKLNITLTHK